MLNLTHKLPAHVSQSMLVGGWNRPFSSLADLPDRSASFCFLEAQRHVYPTGIRPDDEGFWNCEKRFDRRSSPRVSPCCFWYPSSLVILVSSKIRSGCSSDFTKILESSYTACQHRSCLRTLISTRSPNIADALFDNHSIVRSERVHLLRRFVPCKIQCRGQTSHCCAVHTPSPAFSRLLAVGTAH